MATLTVQDVLHFEAEFSKNHINPFAKISKDEFKKRVSDLCEYINQNSTEKHGNNRALIKLAAIIASVGDAHSNIMFDDGYIFPFDVLDFDNDYYLFRVDNSFAEILNAKLIKINGIDIHDITKQLKTLIPHENDYYALRLLPRYICTPMYLLGMDLIPNYDDTIFTVESNGHVKDVAISAKKCKINEIDWSIKKRINIFGNYTKIYDFWYVEESNALVFCYNRCMNMPELSFESFVEGMFNYMEDKKIEKFIVDLRYNGGGDSKIFLPFIDRVKSYVEKNPSVKLCVLVGRRTFSSGMFSIYQIMDAMPNTISIGEPTGGAIDCFGEIRTFNLPDSKIQVQYSTKYFEFSKMFCYQNKGIDTFIPDVDVPITFEDYIENDDVVLRHALDMV